jgi:hypothetical protein
MPTATTPRVHSIARVWKAMKAMDSYALVSLSTKLAPLMLIDKCQDIDECSLVQSPCSSLAYCNNTKGSFDCTCTDGYEGGGVGSDGCTQVIEPVTPPVTDNVPEKAPTGAAGVSSGASLFERSKEVLFVFLLCVCVAALKLF